MHATASARPLGRGSVRGLDGATTMGCRDWGPQSRLTGPESDHSTLKRAASS